MMSSALKFVVHSSPKISPKRWLSLQKCSDSNLRLFLEVISESQEEELLTFLKPILLRKRYEGTSTFSM